MRRWHVGVVLFLGGLLAWAVFLCSEPAGGADVDENALRQAVTFYASFDEALEGDFGGGDRTFWTRFEHDTDKGKYVIEKRHDAQAIRIARDKGIHGGALECVQDLPRRGMLFFPARGKLAVRKGGWGGAVSVWLKPRADTPFCDPVYITQKRWNDGGIWFDYNHEQKGDLRMGAYPALAAGQKPPEPDDPHPSMLRLKEKALRPDAWNHVVLSWENADSGKKDGRAVLYIDGKPVGEVKDIELTLDWDLDETRIFVAFLYRGLMDEFAVFGRPVSAAEVGVLQSKPGVLAALKK
jgi:hypothetical protein